MSAGILAIWNDIAPEGLEHFERWYAREHLHERVGVPGFRFGRRYEAVAGGDRRFFAFYEVDDPAVLASAAYVERLENPTAWTQETMRSWRNMVRTVCDLRYAAGDLIGSHAVVLRADGAMNPTAAGGRPRRARRRGARTAVDRSRRADPRHSRDAEPRQGPAHCRRARHRVRAPLRCGAHGAVVCGATGGARHLGPQRARHLCTALHSNQEQPRIVRLS
jgi:hypothetical protein